MKQVLKKKICIVSPLPPPYGGMAVQAQKLSEQLRMEGYEIVSVATNATLPSSSKIINLIPFLRTIFRQVLFLTRLNRALKKVHTVYFLTGFIDFFFWVTFPALILIYFHKKPVVLSARGGAARIFFRKYGKIVKPILRKLNGVTVPSGFLKEAFKDELNIDPVIVPNIADLDQFKFKERKKFSPKFIVTRSLEPIYDLPTVIKAFALIKKKYSKAVLGVVGDGSQKKILIALIQKLNLQDDIQFYGEVTHQKINDIYKEYDIFLNSSKVDNLPGSILEAYATGLPVVSTNAGGIPFMVEHETTGLLSEIADFKELAKNAIKIIENPDLGRSLVSNGYKELNIYSWEHIKKLLLPLILK